MWRYLDSHPNISAHGEMFLTSLKREDTYKMFKATSVNRLIHHYINRRKSVDNYLNKLFIHEKGIDAVGFKLMYNHLFPELEEWIKAHNVYVLHLIRNNLLKTILSRETARKRDIYHATSTDKIPKVKVYLDPDLAIRQINKILRNIEFYARLFAGLPYLEITYEDFTSQRETTTKTILDFLKVPYLRDMSVPLKKLNPDSLEELIENYDEIERVLKSTDFEEYLK